MAQKIFTDQSWNEFAAGISALKAKSDGTNIAYGTCSTAAATAAKVITTVGDTEWNLKAGSFITIMFSATNTAKNPTFNVNGTGAKNVFYTTTQITSSNLSYAGYANRPMNFMYDGTQYRFIGLGVDSNSDTKVNQQELTSNSDRSILLGSNNTTAAATTGTYKSTKFKYNPSTDVLTVGTVKGNLSGTATYATNSGTSTYSNNSAKATTATNAGTATYAKSAGTASRLGNSTIGSATRPIYINAGNPTTCTYTLGASVPSGAKFTDTTYQFIISDGVLILSAV